MDKEKLLIKYYDAMFEKLGPSYWWPGETPLEICVGAILTQNTNWKNVEKAIWNLKERKLLDAEKLFLLPEEELAELIRPAGYYRIKTKRLKNFLRFLFEEVSFDIEKLKHMELDVLRNKLLEIKGIGPETADSIILYALDKPSFVVDAYTYRIFQRHQIVDENITYEDLRSFFMNHLPKDVELYKEYHALIVRVGKKWCGKKVFRCDGCPLNSFLK